jgi:hypothetical protein
MNVSLFICSYTGYSLEEFHLKYLHALLSIFLLLAASAAAGSFSAEMDVDTYVDANNANQSFADSDLLWAASAGGQPSKEVYLSFINLLGAQGFSMPDQVTSATLTLDVAQVDKPGKIRAYFLHGATLAPANWYTKGDYDAGTSSSPVEIDQVGSCTLDVTPIIKKAVESCTEDCPYSIVLVAEDDASVAFASSEASSGDKPVLEYAMED